jgi:hypothetical protein
MLGIFGMPNTPTVATGDSRMLRLDRKSKNTVMLGLW